MTYLDQQVLTQIFLCDTTTQHVEGLFHPPPADQEATYLRVYLAKLRYSYNGEFRTLIVNKLRSCSPGHVESGSVLRKELNMSATSTSVKTTELYLLQTCILSQHKGSKT